MENKNSAAEISQILDIEWNLFQDVNGSDKVSCQEDRSAFENMRRAQFQAWTPEVLAAYHGDLEAAKAAGRSLIREKYIHMMKYSTPEQYAALMDQIMLPTPEQSGLVDQILAVLLAQTKELHKRYPYVSGAGRPLSSAEDTAETTSFETYQRGELYTYSAKTLAALLNLIQMMEREGESYSERVLENGVCSYGYADLAEAESAAREQSGGDFYLQASTGLASAV